MSTYQATWHVDADVDGQHHSTTVTTAVKQSDAAREAFRQYLRDIGREYDRIVFRNIELLREHHT